MVNEPYKVPQSQLIKSFLTCRLEITPEMASLKGGIHHITDAFCQCSRCYPFLKKLGKMTKWVADYTTEQRVGDQLVSLPNTDTPT